MDFSKVTALLDDLPKGGVPCCDLSVSLDGVEIYRHGVGFSDENGKNPIDRQTHYWIYSASKVITCVAAARLLQDGGISLSDPVSRYLPSFATLTVKNRDGSIKPTENVMTVGHLFTMTSGLDYDLRAPALLEARQVPGAGTVSVCSVMNEKPLSFEPGTNYQYSLGHDVLAAVVEVASGMKFSDYLHKVMLHPLGMTETTFRPTERQMELIAAQYQFRAGPGIATPCGKNNVYILTPDYESGGAGICTTVDDYMKLVTCLALGGTAQNGYCFLKPETIADMEVNRLPDAGLNTFVSGRLWGYGWGLCGRVHMNPGYSQSRSSVGEFGWDGAAGAFAMVDRKRRIALYFGCSTLGCNYLYNWIHPLLRNMVYDAIDG